MTLPEVSVTGLGLFTAAGGGVRESWETVCAGRPTAVLVEEDQPHLACRAPEVVDRQLGAALARKPDRATRLGLLAAREAVADAGLEPADWDGARVAVLVGNSTGGAQTLETQHRALLAGGAQDMSPFAVPSGLGNSVAAQVSIDLGAAGDCLMVNTACASGTTALGLALDQLRLGRCDIAVVGGTEAALTPYYLAGFDRLHALSRRFDDPAGASRPFDAGRDGFVMAEGAGFLVLERTADARSRGARRYARLLGYGAASDAYHVVKPRTDGRGLAAAIRAALADAGVAPDEVAHVNAHATATPLGDRIEAAVLAELLPHRPPVTSTKGVTGHALGAAGAIEAVLTVLTVAESLVPPVANLDQPDPAVELDLVTRCRSGPVPLALCNSAGFGGHNGALVFASA